jgi:hypothetical protein
MTREELFLWRASRALECCCLQIHNAFLKLLNAVLKFRILPLERMALLKHRVGYWPSFLASCFHVFRRLVLKPLQVGGLASGGPFSRSALQDCFHYRGPIILSRSDQRFNFINEKAQVLPIRQARLI